MGKSWEKNPRVGKLFETTAKDAMSGERDNMPPLSFPLPERPPVENWTIIPGQNFLSPCINKAYFSGLEVGV